MLPVVPVKKISFSSLISDGIIARNDIMKIPPNLLKLEDNFNLRIEGAELSGISLDQHIENICVSILNGDDIPPIDVRINTDGDIFVVDGHCRTRAYLLAIAKGADIKYVLARNFKGNDVDRVVKIINSSQGRALTLIEIGMGYNRLIKFGWSETDIAKHFNKTINQINNTLLLANSNNDIQQLVIENKISASNAIDILRKFGDKSSKYLHDKLETANKKGKTRLTSKDLLNNKLPKKIIDTVVDRLEKFYDNLPNNVFQEISQYSELENTKKHLDVTINMSILSELIKSVEDIYVEKTRIKERNNKKLTQIETSTEENNLQKNSENEDEDENEDE